VTAVITLFEGRFDRELLSGALTGWIALVPDVALGLIAAILIDVRPASAVLALGIGVCLIAALRAYAVVTARYRVLEVLDSFTDELGTAVLDDRLHTELLGQLRDRLHADSAWIEVIGDGPGRLELPGGSDHLVATELPAGADDLRERARGGAVALAGSHRTGDGIVGIVKVGDDRLLVGVADRRGEVRSFDHEDVRLFDVLVAHASVALQNVRLVDQLRTEVRANEDLATLDQLTGLPNRTLFTRRLDDARSSGSPVAVLLLGIDRFKDVNDTLGHQAGDELLVAIGGRLAAATGPDSVVARLGGDEFAVLWWGLPEDEAVVRSHGVIDAVDGLYPVMGIEIDVSAAGGLATQGTQQTTAVALLRCADVARYLAKEARSSLEVYSPDRDTYSPARLAMAGRLRSAIDAGELTLHYQPQLDMATQQVVGAEALIRWMPPGRPPVSPVDLIEVAERTGLIRPLTQFVLREAVGQAARWAAMGMPLRVSANLSARNLTDEGLVEQLAALLAEHDLSPSLFEVEVTETSVMADPAASVAALRAIHALGVNISVDDFGTGHSSLAYLTQLPVDQLKIDMSFVQVLGQGDAPTAVVGAIVDLGRRLGLEVIAEGVETAGNVDVLRGLGCHLAQGYFYSRPLAVPAFEDWFATHTGATPQPAARPAVAPPGARRHPTPA
jgi:diguanylate cyclase (GGDEF)-like protein